MTNINKTVLYTGITSDLYSRVAEHKTHEKWDRSFTAKYAVSYLLYYERFMNVTEAIAREKEIKGWRREKKERLIETVNPYWKFIEL